MTQFAVAQMSSRNLVLGRLNGTNAMVVRDITDISQPTNVAGVQLESRTLQPWGPWKPTFIGGTEIGDGTDDHLSRFLISSGQRTTVLTGCPNTIVTFGWNRVGDYMTYVWEVPDWHFEWHLVGHGTDRLLAVTPGWCHCDGEGPADNYSIAAGFSPVGQYVYLAEAMPAPGGPLPIQIRTLDGDLVASLPAASMPVWSGSDLYFRDTSGVARWRGGSVSRVLDGEAWIRPNSSPAGGQVVYWARASDGLGRVYLFDEASGTKRILSTQPRMEPLFLSSRYIWYQGQRYCTDADHCFFGTRQSVPTGVAYIYDLTDGTESPSSIAEIYDVWPHAG